MQEIEQFKRNINLSEFAAHFGYSVDKRESSQNSAVMRHTNGDKVIITRSKSGDWVYFSVRDEKDNGSIIDFLQNRGGGSLGEVRKSLRGWLGSSRPVVPQASFMREISPVSHDRAAVLVAWEKAHFRAAVPYLEGRGLGPEVLKLSRFNDRFRVDHRGNVLFPHHDREGLSGFELKNKDFTGFASGGVKGLWFSACRPSDTALVLTESAIDALSFHVLNPSDTARYMSTGGALNPQQPALIRGALDKLPPGSVAFLAFDNDAGGDKLAQEVQALAPAHVEVRRPLPPVGKDWNQALKLKLGLI